MTGHNTTHALSQMTWPTLQISTFLRILCMHLYLYTLLVTLFLHLHSLLFSAHFQCSDCSEMKRFAHGNSTPVFGKELI